MCFDSPSLATISKSLDKAMAERVATEASPAVPAAAPKKKHQDVETQNLEKVTDYVEEAESEELGKVLIYTMYSTILRQGVKFSTNIHYVCARL